MARPPKLRQHQGYWYTQAGSLSGVYFGRCDQVPYHDAQLLFRKYIATLGAPLSRQVAQTHSLTVAEMCDRHLKWVRSERSDALLRQRKSILNSWCNHTVDEWNGQRLSGHGRKIGLLRSDAITRWHVEQFLHYRCTTPSKTTKRPLGDKARRALVIALKATWNWAADFAEDGGGSLLPDHHRPLAKLSRGFIRPKDLTEADLPTDEEVEVILAWSGIDPSLVRAGCGKWRRRRGDEQRTPDSQVFADMMRCYHATGSRTSELCHARVRDFMPRTRQICLGKHKRSHTQSNPTIRTIQIDEELSAVLLRNTRNKQADDPLFSRANGKPWDQNQVNARLHAVKQLAVEHGEAVRSHITPYSFRDLYISELLMLGDPPFKVAKLAGTSLQEIERSYGHFFNDDLASSQARLVHARQQRQIKKQRPADRQRDVG